MHISQMNEMNGKGEIPACKLVAASQDDTLLVSRPSEDVAPVALYQAVTAHAR